MHPLVCGKFMDQVLLVNRANRKGLRIPDKLYQHFISMQLGKEQIVPSVFESLFIKVGYEAKWNNPFDAIVIRPTPSMSFGRAAWEITRACNFRCKHCILGHQIFPSLPLQKRFKVLDILSDAGCFWLQITGGEATTDKYFVETYQYAYEKGFLINLSTNGSRLHLLPIRNLLSEYPPFRVAVSFYGASAESVYALTGNRHAYSDFVAGMESAKEIGLNVRANIIRTIFNQNELSQMRDLANSFGFDQHTYTELLPTLGGMKDPFYVTADCVPDEELNVEIRKKKLLSGDSWLDRCGAGRTFFHVDPMGMASICPIARKPQVNLLEEGINGLTRLEGISKTLLDAKEECGTCQLWQNCLNCPPKLALYRATGEIPASICQRLS